MENFISFILGIASEPSIRPVYSVVPSDAMDETIAENLKGYRSDGPVRIGNAAVDANAARHVWQHHPCRHADVLRPKIAATRGQRAFRPAGDAWRKGRRTRASLPTPASGNFAAAPAFIPIPLQCAGRGAAGWRRSRHTSVSPIGPLIGPKSRTVSSIGCLKKPGATSAARSRRRSATMTSMQACCCCPNSA